MAEEFRPKLLNYNLKDAHLYPWDSNKFKINLQTKSDHVYNTSTYTEKGRVLREFGENFEKFVPRTGVLVEIGTSIGFTTQELRSLRPEMDIYGCDINPLVIGHIAINSDNNIELRKVNLVVLDGLDLPFAPDSIDVLVWMNSLVQVLQTMSDNKMKNMYQRIDNTLKPEGVFLLSGYIDGNSYRAVLIKNQDRHNYRVFLPTNNRSFEEYFFNVDNSLPEKFIEVHKDFFRFINIFYY